MEKLSEIKKIDDDIDIEVLRYVQQLNVEDAFLQKLETDKDLQQKVTALKSDLYMMEKIKDSIMFKSIKKIGAIKIKNSIAEYISGFTLLSPLTSRGGKKNKTKIYHFQNASVIVKDNIANLNIENIKKSLIILKDNIEFVNISSLKEYSTNLEKGNYTILLDSKTININIE